MSFSLKRTALYFYFFQFFFTLYFWFPIFYEYQKHFGLTDAQIFQIQSIYYLMFCFAEIPTGLFADKFGARTSMRLGAWVLLLANALPIFWTTFTGFLLHWIAIAVSRSLISGASSAYLFEQLKVSGFHDQYKIYDGRARAYGLFGKMICWSFVGWLTAYSIKSPYYLTAIASAISIVYAYMLPAVEDPEAGERFSDSLKDRLVLIKKILTEQKSLIFIMIQGVGIFVLTRICQVNLFQPFLKEKGFGIEVFGLILAVITLFEALGSYKPDIIKEVGSDRRRIFIFTILLALSMVCMGIGGKVLAVVGLAVFSYASGLMTPVQMQMMNENITDSKVRASLLSVESILDRAVSALVAAGLGAVVASGQIDNFLYMSAVSAIVLVSISIYFQRRFKAR